MEKLQIPKVLEPILQAINGVPYYWAEMPLEDLSELPQFNRKIVVSGFNSPDLEDENDERIYITIKQLFINKETGKIFMTRKQKPWEILSSLKSIFPNPADATKPVFVNENTLDDEGEVVETNKVILKVPSVKLMRFLLLTKQAHLTDLFAANLKDFAIQFKEELDTI